MEIAEILKMYNVDKLSLGEIGEFYGVSKTTVSRFLSKNGYIYDRYSKEFVQQMEIEQTKEYTNNVTHETINTGNSKTINNHVSKNANTVKCTFDLPQELHKKLKVKCALDGIKMVDYVRELLEKSL